MILPDVNLLVYAYNSDAPDHARARSWWEDCLSSTATVGLAWTVMLGFVRVMTSRRILTDPMLPAEAFGHVRSWLDQPQAQIVHPGSRHLELVEQLITSTGAAGELMTDAHLAALAIELGAELHSNDADFARFPGLRWHNPLGLER